MDGVNINAVLWIFSMIVLVVIELSTVGLYCIWFAFGALCGLVLAMWGVSTWIQITAFAIVSAVLFFFARPKLESKINSKTIKTNAGALIGKTGYALTDITQQNGGQVKVNSQPWSARLSDENAASIPRNCKVLIEDIVGVKLIVSAVMEDDDE